MDMDTLEADFQLSVFKGMYDKSVAEEEPLPCQLNGKVNGDNRESNHSEEKPGSDLGSEKESTAAEGSKADGSKADGEDGKSEVESDSRSAQPTPVEEIEENSLDNQKESDKEDDSEPIVIPDSDKEIKNHSKDETREEDDTEDQNSGKDDGEIDKSVIELDDSESRDGDQENEDAEKDSKKEGDADKEITCIEAESEDSSQDVKENTKQTDDNASEVKIIEDKSTEEVKDSKHGDHDKGSIKAETSPGTKQRLPDSEKKKVISLLTEGPSKVQSQSQSPVVIKEVPRKVTAASATTISGQKVVLGETMRPMAKHLYDLGLDLARQQVYKDLIKIQNKKQNQSKLGEKEQKQLDKLIVAYDNIVSKNDPYQLDMIRCDKCGFNTESENVMALHREYSHKGDSGDKSFHCECSFCDYQCMYPGDFFVHMEKVHKKRGRIHMRMANFTCPFCPFENNSKRAYQTHLQRCERSFKLKSNLLPSHADFDIPLVHTRQSQAKMTSTPPLLQQPRPQTVTRSTQPAQLRPAGRVSDILRNRVPTAVAMPKPAPVIRPGGILPIPAGATGQQLFQVGNQLYTLIHNQGQAFLTPYMQGTAIPSISLPPRSQVTSTTPGGLPPPPPLKAQPQLIQTGMPPQAAAAKQPSKSVADLLASKGAPMLTNKLPQKIATPQSVMKSQPNQSSGASSGFEICEICGGFVKDRESLRIHFFYAHKVEIPVDVFRNRQPHLLCDVCKQRFWTYQGMVRHTQSVHENQGKKVENATSCVICGEKNLPVGLLGHLVARHNVSIRKLIENNKCFLCKAKFPVHFLLKVHMTKNHKEVISSTNMFNAFLKSLGLSKAFMPVSSSEGSNNPVPTGLFENSSNAKKKTEGDPGKKRKSIDSDMVIEVSPAQHPFKCSRCPRRFPLKNILQKHYQDVHRNQKEECMFCGEAVLIGRPYVRHMKREHCGECSVVLKRLPAKETEHYMARGKRKHDGEGDEDKSNSKGDASAPVVLDDAGDDADDEPLVKKAKQCSEDENDDKANQDKRCESDKENEKENDKAPSEPAEEEEEEDMEVQEVGGQDEGHRTAETEEEKNDKASKSQPDTVDSDSGEIIELDGETIVVQKQEDD